MGPFWGVFWDQFRFWPAVDGRGQVVPPADGWVFMWTLLLLFAWAIVVAIERAWVFWRTLRVDYGALDRLVRPLLEERNWGRLLELWRALQPRLVGRLGEALTETYLKGADLERMRAAAEAVLLEAAPRLERRVRYLNTIAHVATLMGLAGTIYGLIVAFSGLGGAILPTAERVAVLSRSIATAMVTTMGGLMVAIPSFLAHSFLQHHLERRYDELEAFATGLIERLLD
ncbi:MAG: MotA/TolQ/ExbB proton channel family protein [Bacteroidetes bacterium]|nr:MotA/TolQ/ExbB proton channel family protein [Bacteroidota bacterium]MDW8137613.1 MotA/TolQ/ExbB proton channel family protein [Bacteroidota bacterium]